MQITNLVSNRSNKSLGSEWRDAASWPIRDLVHARHDRRLLAPHVGHQVPRRLLTSQAKLGLVLSLKQLFDVEICLKSFLMERVKISVLTSSSNLFQEGHPGPNASLDGWHVLCFAVPGCFFILHISI